MKLKHVNDEHNDVEGWSGKGGEESDLDDQHRARPNVDVNSDRRLQICDRRSSSRVGLQRGFTAFIAPLHCGIAALLPRLAPLAARLAATRAAWEARGADEDAALEAEAAALPWGSAQSPSR